jgi:hypothetical protein
MSVLCCCANPGQEREGVLPAAFEAAIREIE